jgi:hypothetical protein
MHDPDTNPYRLNLPTRIVDKGETITDCKSIANAFNPAVLCKCWK